MKVRNKKITVRLTDKERSHLQEQADLVDLGIEPFVRNLINGTQMKPYPAEERQAILRQVSGIANNCNQIAKRINSGDETAALHRLNSDMIAQLLGILKRY